MRSGWALKARLDPSGNTVFSGNLCIFLANILSLSLAPNPSMKATQWCYDSGLSGEFRKLSGKYKQICSVLEFDCSSTSMLRTTSGLSETETTELRVLSVLIPVLCLINCSVLGQYRPDAVDRIGTSLPSIHPSALYNLERPRDTL
ncbi:hypothetical protein DPEC_G00201090 [Dallia pectoralis]|uniref:Uncharacterized protein n=1 Tax=Dallia pectoralis TaxID=75939 RepID=A0ACC2G965_DALPE|nr:hypothetical protein DPEC_G00201090 [Dallia pectoralis]